MKGPRKITYSCGIVPVRRVGSHWEFLLLRSYNYWDFPKGLQEKDEDSWTAALRELREDTGFDGARAKWGQESYDTAPYSNSKVARYFLAEVPADQEVVFLPNPLTGIFEHHEHRWLPYAEARALLGPRVQQVIDWAQEKLVR